MLRAPRAVVNRRGACHNRFMLVALFADPHRTEDVRTIMRTLRTHSIHSKGVTLTAGWTGADRERIDHVLEGATHLLLLPAEGPHPDWFHYLAGYAHGREIPVAALCSGVPMVFSDLTTVTLENAENYVLAERSSWERSNRVTRARARLRGREHDPSAFYRCAAEGDLKTVEDFLAVGISPDQRSAEGVPVLVGAVRGRSVSVVQRLLNEGADVNATSGADGASPLGEASSLGLETVVGVLLAHGADPNQLTANGQTPLMLAASQGHLDVVERLLSAGATADIADSLGMTAAEYARLFGRTEILAALENQSTLTGRNAPVTFQSYGKAE